MVAQVVEPLDTNRGVDVHLDYLKVSVWMDVREVAVLVLDLLGITGDLRDFEHSAGMNFYRSTWRHPSGVVLYGDHRSSPGCCTVEFKGQTAPCIFLDRLRAALLSFDEQSIRWQVPRLDIAIDQMEITADLLNVEWIAGRVKSHAERESRRWIESGCDTLNPTLYLGSRESLRMLRVYEHGDVHRIELETHDERATAIMRDLLGHEVGEWQERMLAHVLDFAEFDFDAWQRLKGSVKAARLCLARLQSTIEQTAGWLFSVRKSIAKVVEVKGVGFLDDLVLRGLHKFTAADRCAVAFARSLAVASG